MSEAITASRRRGDRPAPAPARLRRASGRFVSAAAALAVLSTHTAHAQQGGAPRLNVIRDAEIEELLRDYTRPILRAAKLGGQNIEVVIIGERAFNAFVADGRRIFVNIGALYESETPNQIIGVLAHESGHIAGGHLARMRDQIANAQTASIVAMLVAAAGVAAGAATNSPGVGQALPGLMLGPQEMIRRSLLGYARQQEEAADRAAVNFLDATGQSAKGMLQTFARFADQSMFVSRSVDPYTLSHPMPRERISQLEHIARASPNFNRADPPALQFRHEMMRAKITGFIDRPDAVLRRYPPSNNGLPARYARAISSYRFGDIRSAIAQVDTLIAEQPNNPYFYELKGQTLLESGRAREAVAPLRRAVSLSNGSALIRMMLGQALVQSGDGALADEATAVLRQALAQEPNAPLGYRQLAIALGRKGDRANADLASAQASFNEGDFPTAKQLAARAQRGLPKGSPGWLKADDIVNYKPPQIQQN
ncbi:MAG: M48 family metallopeptidase [Bradyrhizobiaceae bacterium]|nr:M48 family metallopeptidase [Bradyrhizobiaceae bacterium]